MKKIKNIVFDMGNVLLEWNARKNIERVEPNLQRADILQQEIFTSGVWEKQDTADLTVDQAMELVKSRLDESYHVAIQQIFKDWYHHIEIYKDVQDFAIQLSQQGYAIYILSNTSDVYYAIEKAGLLPISQVLAGKVLSFEEKCMKPDPAIFQILFDRYQLSPAESVFIDDIAGNIQVAESLGMTGIQCQNSQQVVDDLQKLLGIS